VKRRTHPKKEIEKALREAELAGLNVTDSSGDQPHPFRVYTEER